MCKDCSCDNYEKCSIVGFMPMGFCCENCILFINECVCNNIAPKTEIATSKALEGKIKLIHTSIEGEFLKVIIEQEGKKIPIHFDLKKFLDPT